MKTKVKAHMDYFILKQTWNRNIIYGPYVDYASAVTASGDMLAALARGPEAKGGPIRLTVLKSVSSIRMRRGRGGLVGYEHSSNSNIRTGIKGCL